MRKNTKKGVLLLAAGMAAGMLIMFVIGLALNSGDSLMDKTADKKLSAIMENIDETYYRGYDTEDLQEGMYKGVVAGLGDAYSSYMTKEEYDRFIDDNSGSFYGVGITILNDNGSYKVTGVQEDSPAEKAGVKPGDLVLQVDGKSYDDLDELVNNLRGREKSEVKVTFERNGASYSVTMKRAEITEASVKSRKLEGNIGYIAISSFIETTADDFAAALEDMESSGAEGLIIDIRNNGGGLVQSSLEIADMLIDEGRLLTYVDKDGKITYTDAEAGCTDLPYVLLVNENSASASEILAAAVQDNGGGKLVGSKTFGKGVIQVTNRLYDGSAVKLTGAEYRSPDGHVIDKKGVKPDIEVKGGSGGKDTQLERAEELLN